MKEATGGTSMLYVLLIFLAIFITFVAVAFNYARAFRVKNAIIDIIEKNEGIDNADVNGTRTEIEEYLNKVKYKVDGVSCASGYDNLFGSEGDGLYGYCIGKSTSADDSIRNEVYYSVETFAVLSFPFANLSLKIPVKGETRMVVNKEVEADFIGPSIPDTPTYNEPVIKPGSSDECEECRARCESYGRVWRDNWCYEN